MTKKETNNVIDSIKRQTSKRLQTTSSQLQTVMDERRTTQNMYFWTPSNVASGRRYNEKRRNMSIDVAISKDFIVHYSRSYSESCRYVYASDYITDSQGNKLTIRDLKKLVEGIDTILAKRNS